MVEMDPTTFSKQVVVLLSVVEFFLIYFFEPMIDACGIPIGSRNEGHNMTQNAIIQLIDLEGFVFERFSAGPRTFDNTIHLVPALERGSLLSSFFLQVSVFTSFVAGA